MADLINLRRARKAKARGEKDKAADAARIAHGAPKAVRNLAQSRADKAEKTLIQHQLDRKEDDN